jgi:alcohol dehydrogenase (cytochrome c)
MKNAPIMLLLLVLLRCSPPASKQADLRFPTGQVPFERIEKANRDSLNWLTYSGNYQSHRYSPLSQINKLTIAKLKVAWIYQTVPGLVEATPIVVDGVMYITEPPSTVTALDVLTGRKLWTWSPVIPEGVKALGFPPVNRGVAILNETIFIGTLDAHLVALDAKSGAVRWDKHVAENKEGYAITTAPVVVKDKVIIGISGGEAGIRGFLDAYKADNGERAWRFYTIPGEGEARNDTWEGDSWKTGGGSTWVPGSYDPSLDLLYWGIGNPGPDWNGDHRKGDNLYTCSVVALNLSDGTLKWHFQFTPHDVHDWDANQTSILVDGYFKGKPRKLLATANRNAFYYLLDRETGEYLLSAPYTKQTWAKRIDEKGRPELLPNTEPTQGGTLVFPSLQGATNWYSPSFSRLTGYFYVAAREMGSYYFKSEVEYKPGEPFLGGGEQALNGDQAKGSIKALDATTGEIKWTFDLHSPPWAGVMSTAGGLVFAGTNEGNFLSLDASSGKLMWEFQTGAPIRTNPMSYGFEGKQYVAIAAGNALFVFTTPE